MIRAADQTAPHVAETTVGGPPADDAGGVRIEEGLDVWGRTTFRIVITLPPLPRFPDLECPFRVPWAGAERDEVAGDRLRTRDGHGISRVSESCQAPDHPSETGITPDLRSAQPEEKSTGVDS